MDHGALWRPNCISVVIVSESPMVGRAAMSDIRSTLLLGTVVCDSIVGVTDTVPNEIHRQ